MVRSDAFTPRCLLSVLLVVIGVDYMANWETQFIWPTPWSTSAVLGQCVQDAC
jgi:hypothetical protein